MVRGYGILDLGFMRVILHADLNSFFASAQQQADPALRGQPVGILKAKGRSCIIAASNEAKTFGVKTGCNIYEAKRFCPQIILVPADFAKYEILTQKFIHLAAEFSDRVEVFSLDEVFLDITDTAWWFGGPVSLSKKLQARVSQELGEFIGCSVGIAGNKLLAKMASGLAPRRGILQVTAANKQALLARAPFTEVCGIGYRLTRRLAALGINSLPQISAAPQELLLARFGPYWGRRLPQIARGEDDSPVVTTGQLKQAKSVSRTYTLYQDTTDQFKIRALLRNLVEEAVWKLRQMGLVGRQFGLGVRGGGSGRVGHVTRKSFTDSGRLVFDEVSRLWQGFNWKMPLRFGGVWIGLLEVKTNLTQPLFDQKQDNLWQTIDRVNRRYGTYTVFPASMLGGRIIRPEVNGYLGDKYFRLAGR